MCVLQIYEIVTLQWNLSKQYGCLKLVQFSKTSGRLPSTGSEILTFGSLCSRNFQPILDCFILKFKMEYDNLENMKTDCVNTVVSNLHQIKRLKFFLGQRYTQDYELKFSIQMNFDTDLKFKIIFSVWNPYDVIIT